MSKTARQPSTCRRHPARRPAPVACAAARAAAALVLIAPPLTRVAAADSWAPASEWGGGNKSSCTLLNPTPRPLLRELSTDRPDVTESPYTVDAGHFQGEISFLEYTRDDVRIDDRNSAVDAEQLAVLPANLKVGLLNNVDLQFVLTPWLRNEAGDGPFGVSASGFGNVQLRLKVNLWGNDGPHPTFGDTALAVMPFVELPTGGDDLGFADDVEGGVIVPFATTLPRDFGLGLMAEFDIVKSDDGGYELEFVHTASVGHDLAGALAGYVEYVGLATGDDHLSSLGAGVTYGLTPDVQLDGGVLIGLSEDAEDFVAFAGMSFRI